MESALAATDDKPPAPALPDGPGLEARLDPFVAAARQGEAEFAAALAAARSAVGRAGAAGSDSWVEAQQALSRAEVARASTTAALADLDALTLAEARQRPLSPADIARLDRAVQEVQGIADSQQERIAALEARLSGS
jgi:hypothetical protein